MSASIDAHSGGPMSARLPTFCAVFETYRGPVCSAKCSGYEANALKNKSSGRAQQILREWYRSPTLGAWRVGRFGPGELWNNELLKGPWGYCVTWRIAWPARWLRRKAKARLAEADRPLTDGFHLVIDALKLNGIDTIYGVPGIPITDLGRMAQAAGIRVISFRHEQNAGNAAAITGFLTKKPGICLTVPVPGFLNALTARPTPRPMLSDDGDQRFVGALNRRPSARR